MGLLTAPVCCFDHLYALSQATVEPVLYADLGVVSKKKRGEAPEVDQHTVTYSTLDMAATSHMKASTMPAPSKGGSTEQGEGRKSGQGQRTGWGQ